MRQIRVGLPKTDDSESGRLDILPARSLGTLAAFERDRLSFVKIVEGDLRARRLVKKELAAVARGDEPESLAAHESFDRAADWSHASSFLELV
jgi:hypothetical protein